MVLQIILKIAFTILWLLICYAWGNSLDKAEKKGRGPFHANRLLMYIYLFTVTQQYGYHQLF